MQKARSLVASYVGLSVIENYCDTIRRFLQDFSSMVIACMQRVALRMAQMRRDFFSVTVVVTVFECGKDTIQEACRCIGSELRQTENCSLE